VRGDNLLVSSEVTDGSTSVPVSYIGIFRICSARPGRRDRGALDCRSLQADNVLAKHDEPTCRRGCRRLKQGHWKTEGGYGLAGDETK
jgi:cytochrome c-type biogenesis protein CcmE